MCTLGLQTMITVHLVSENRDNLPEPKMTSSDFCYFVEAAVKKSKDNYYNDIKKETNKKKKYIFDDGLVSHHPALIINICTLGLQLIINSSDN